MWRLALLIAFVLPVLDLWLLVRIGAAIGTGATLLLALGGAVAGLSLARSQGARLLTTPPPHVGIQGLLVLIGAVLMLAPGVITDVLGLALLVPATRGWITSRTVRWLAPGTERVTLGDPPRPSQPATGPHPFSSPFDDLP